MEQVPDWKRIGKQVGLPNPKCPICEHYMQELLNILGTETFWVCSNCKAQYEVINDSKNT